ncbi:hypothetical protein [Marinobacter sp. ELB17]|uniref:hypothetical protein n=1 Tax=Marinobacter sp. ELB17 TaxID=270374 RepID=UPI0000F3B3BB|nr:hypothetical protein [Marinobacter sp. ELB17]EAZ98376.1 hypothetical protein MELB17_09123 [Marinobacter sp. ELB17]
MRQFKHATLIVAMMVGVGGAAAPQQSQACACIAAASSGAIQISGLVGAGATAVTSALYTGFQAVASTVDGSTGKQTKSLVDALTAHNKIIAAEIQKLPVYEKELESAEELLNPAMHATDGCSYTDRASDTIVAERLSALQEENLNQTSGRYNEMTSSYPLGVNVSDRFLSQTGSLMRSRPAIVTAGMDLVAKPGQFGAFTGEELQNVATAINLTTNPNPPARIPEPSTPGAIKVGVKADLYNLRMSIPQAVLNQILSYDAPVVDIAEDSWAGRQLARITPNAASNFTSGDAKVSKSDLLKLMATHRVKDSGWVTNLAAKDAKGVIKDLAITKADSLVMDYEIWLMDRNQALLMSQVLAAQNRQKAEDR